MCPGLRTEILCMQEECSLLSPSLPLLLRALVAGGQVHLLGGQQASQRRAPPGAAGASVGWGAGKQQALTPPQEQDVCGAGGDRGTEICGLGGVCDIALPFSSGAMSRQEGRMETGMYLFSRDSQA